MSAIEISNLSKIYNLYNNPADRLKQFFFSKNAYCQQYMALHPINLVINKGEAVGIIGVNGSGKSTLLQLICGTLTPTSGDIKINGKISALLELGSGFNPEFTGKENIYLNAAILGMSKSQLDTKYESIAEFASIGEYINYPVKTYSSGMYIRLAFAVAVANDPDILIVDEALAVGDEIFQRKCFARIREIKEKGGTILFVSHSPSTIIEICDRAILLNKGELLFDGTPKKTIVCYHKLIYGSVEKNHPVFIQEQSEFFDPEFKSETVVIYEPNGAVITNPRVISEDGTQVNILKSGKKYSYEYEVEMLEDAEDVRFGMLIKSKSGVELGGYSSAKPNHGKILKKGQKLSATFSFVANLGNGVFFLNAGCSGKVMGEDKFLHRILDAVPIRILVDMDNHATGMVDFGIKYE